MAKHTFNMHHQLETFNKTKKNLQENEAITLCDWSENYACKYTEEVQAVHFGASRNQISLHTGVDYIGQKDQDNLIKIFFCTVSNAVAIWVHLVPILSMINNEFPQVKIFHFYSDGPISQYRNKTNFISCEPSMFK